MDNSTSFFFSFFSLNLLSFFELLFIFKEFFSSLDSLEFSEDESDDEISKLSGIKKSSWGLGNGTNSCGKGKPA